MGPWEPPVEAVPTAAGRGVSPVKYLVFCRYFSKGETLKHERVFFVVRKNTPIYQVLKIDI